MNTLFSVSLQDAKARFFELFQQVQRGQEVIITKAGRPVVRMSPYARGRKIAPPGGMEGKGYWIAPDFDAPVDDIST